jgi:hypothetical protein
MRISTKSGFSSSTQAEKQSDVSILSLIGTGMHAENPFLRHQIMHESEESFFHFSGILSPQNCYLLVCQIDSHTRFGFGNPFQVIAYGRIEFSCVENVIINPIYLNNRILLKSISICFSVGLINILCMKSA